jgi:hypothetical protein
MSDFGTPQPPPGFPETPPPLPRGRSGPPWELEGMSLQSFIDTARGILTDPVVAFDDMRREGGLALPLIYYAIGMLIALIFAMLWQVFGWTLPFGPPSTAELTFSSAMIVYLPICGTIALFVGSLIIHLLLILFGGQKYPYETTFRTLAYAGGSAYPIWIFPMCGWAVATVWMLIVAVIGLSRTQETSTGKAAAAILTPTVLCCGLSAIFSTILIAMLALLLGVAVASSGR